MRDHRSTDDGPSPAALGELARLVRFEQAGQVTRSGQRAAKRRRSIVPKDKDVRAANRAANRRAAASRRRNRGTR